jgi:hypothetical protein
MEYLSIKEQKIELIKNSFDPLLGQKILDYSVAQLFDEEDECWEFWHELPLRLSIGSEKISVSWAKFDDLMIVAKDNIADEFQEQKIRWYTQDIEVLDGAKGHKIVSIALATYPESQFWNRLLLYLDNDTVLDIYNALDENSYALYKKDEIEGELIEIISL